MDGRVKSPRCEVGHLEKATEETQFDGEFHYANYLPQIIIPTDIKIIGEVFGGLAPP